MTRTMMMNFGALFVVFVLGVAVANVGAQKALTANLVPDNAAEASKTIDNDLKTCSAGGKSTTTAVSSLTVTYDAAVIIVNVTILIDTGSDTDMNSATVYVGDDTDVTRKTQCKTKDNAVAFATANLKAVFLCTGTTPSKTVYVEQPKIPAGTTEGKAIKICDIQIGKNVQFMRFDWLIVSAMLLAAVRLTANK